MNLILIGRRQGKLQEISEEIIGKYKVKVDIIVTDFAKGQSIYPDLQASLVDKDIGILVNNVGVDQGGVKYFSEVKIMSKSQLDFGHPDLISELSSLVCYVHVQLG